MNYSLTAKSAAPAPSIRYVSSPPEEITVRLGELKLPERLKSSRFDPERAISLRCAEVFASPLPSIDVARLAEIAPEDIAPDFLHAGSVPINAALLALRFHFLQSVEHIEPPVVEPVAVQPEETASLEPESSPEPILEPVTAMTTSPHPPVEISEVAPPANIPDPVLSESTFEEKISEPIVKPVVADVPAPPEVPPPPAVSLSAERQPDIPTPVAETPTETTAPFISLPPTPAPPLRSSGLDVDPADSKFVPRPRPTARIPDKRTIFNILPALRRQSPATKPVVPPVPQQVEPAPFQKVQEPPEETPTKLPETPEVLESSVEKPVRQEAPPAEEMSERVEEPPPWQDIPPPPVAAASAPAEPEPPAPEPQVSKTIPIEHLPPTALKPNRAVAQELEAAPDEGLGSQDRLQEIFMTEEQLTLDQVLKLCGGLPGIRSCILSKGSSVLSTFNVPEGIDLVSLTGNASAMLDAMRASSMRMGLGAIPAVTIHSEKGPVSFFHSDDLAMLIIHADRGFIPGVREKLHDVVVALGQSNLPLPLEGSSEK